MRHAQRIEDFVRNIVVEQLAGHPLHDITRQRGTVVGVGGLLTRVIYAWRRPALQVLLEREKLLRVSCEKVLECLLESRRVRQQISQRDGLAVSRRDLEVEVTIDIGVEVELPGLDLLHDRS